MPSQQNTDLQITEVEIHEPVLGLSSLASIFRQLSMPSWETLLDVFLPVLLIFLAIAEQYGLLKPPEDSGPDTRDVPICPKAGDMEQSRKPLNRDPKSTRPDAKIKAEDVRKEIGLHREIILRTRNPYTGKSCSPQAQLEARTLPNARLETTFGVNNAFTTQNMKTAGAFKSTARSLLRNATHIRKKVDETGEPTSIDTDANWEQIISQIQKTIREEITGGHEIMNLAEVVQYITLRISMHVLFGTKIETLEDRDAMKYIAKTINILWIRSKNKPAANQNDWSQERRLHQHLFDLTGLDPTNDLLNPMNLILPAYETMWRAVLRGILEIYFRDHPDSQQWQEVLRGFMTISQKEIFHRYDAMDKICPIDIVKEIMRMYPPTRRVNRRFPDNEEGVIRAADIEKLHRNVLLVPDRDADTFRPERWLDIKKDFKFVQTAKKEMREQEEPDAKHTSREYEELGYMPLALSCPAGGKATQGFSFKMIALLVVAVGDGLDGLNFKFTGSDETVSVQAEADAGVNNDENLHAGPAGGVDQSLYQDNTQGKSIRPTRDLELDTTGKTPLTLEALRKLENEHAGEVKNKENFNEYIKTHVADYINSKIKPTKPSTDDPIIVANLHKPNTHDIPNNADAPFFSCEVDERRSNLARQVCPATVTVAEPTHEPEPGPEPEPRRQVWRLEAESPRDELPEIGKALGSERADYLSLVYRRVV